MVTNLMDQSNKRWELDGPSPSLWSMKLVVIIPLRGPSQLMSAQKDIEFWCLDTFNNFPSRLSQTMHPLQGLVDINYIVGPL